MYFRILLKKLWINCIKINADVNIAVLETNAVFVNVTETFQRNWLDIEAACKFKKELRSL